MSEMDLPCRERRMGRFSLQGLLDWWQIPVGLGSKDLTGSSQPDFRLFDLRGSSKTEQVIEGSVFKHQYHDAFDSSL